MKTPSNNSLKAQSRPEQSGTERRQTQNTAASTRPKAGFPDAGIYQVNRQIATDDVLQLLQCWIPRAYEVAEVIGKWVWVSFTEPQPEEVTTQLYKLGFHFNSRRGLWQHPCGVTRDRPPYHPRQKYGSYFPADVKPI